MVRSFPPRCNGSDDAGNVAAAGISWHRLPAAAWNVRVCVSSPYQQSLCACLSLPSLVLWVPLMFSSGFLRQGAAPFFFRFSRSFIFSSVFFLWFLLPRPLPLAVCSHTLVNLFIQTLRSGFCSLRIGLEQECSYASALLHYGSLGCCGWFFFLCSLFFILLRSETISSFRGLRSISVLMVRCSHGVFLGFLVAKRPQNLCADRVHWLRIAGHDHFEGVVRVMKIQHASPLVLFCLASDSGPLGHRGKKKKRTARWRIGKFSRFKARFNCGCARFAILGRAPARVKDVPTTIEHRLMVKMETPIRSRLTLRRPHGADAGLQAESGKPDTGARAEEAAEDPPGHRRSKGLAALAPELGPRSGRCRRKWTERGKRWRKSHRAARMRVRSDLGDCPGHQADDQTQNLCAPAHNRHHRNGAACGGGNSRARPDMPHAMNRSELRGPGPATAAKSRPSMLHMGHREHPPRR